MIIMSSSGPEHNYSAPGDHIAPADVAEHAEAPEHALPETFGQLTIFDVDPRELAKAAALGVSRNRLASAKNPGLSKSLGFRTGHQASSDALDARAERGQLGPERTSRYRGNAT